MANGRGNWRLNAWITALLVLGVIAVGNRLARETLELRVDLSADQLYAPSPVGERMVSGLTDVVRVKAFFTGEVRLGPVQIAKRRLIDQLEELAGAAHGRIEISYVDPNASSEARAEAGALGIEPVPLRSMQGTAEVAQDVYLGLLLRQRGKETVLPFVLPQTFEFGFLGALRKLLRTEEVVVGFLTGDGGLTVGGSDGFQEARALLAGQYRLREVFDLDLGEPVPADVSVLVVARPADLHRRTAFALDQFLQRGGRALFLVDRLLVDLIQGTALPLESGLEELFSGWGLAVGAELIWDQERSNRITTYESIRIGGKEQRGDPVSIPFPLWPNVGVEGMDRETPVTARLQGADLFWAHPIVASDTLPDGVERRDLMQSSTRSFLVDSAPALVLDPALIGRHSVALLAEGDARARILAVALSGTLPSPFLGGAPAARDPIEDALRADRRRRALAEGREPPERGERTTDEPVASASASTQVVVVGDADWASDGKFLTSRNELLFVNLIDWLALEDDLIALRSRMPTERRLDDFVEEERRALGLVGPRADLGEHSDATVARLESQADRSANRRRWLLMGRATGGSLLLALLLGLGWRFSLGRGPRTETGGTA